MAKKTIRIGIVGHGITPISASLRVREQKITPVIEPLRVKEAKLTPIISPFRVKIEKISPVYPKITPKK